MKMALEKLGKIEMIPEQRNEGLKRMRFEAFQFRSYSGDMEWFSTFPLYGFSFLQLT